MRTCVVVVLGLGLSFAASAPARADAPAPPPIKEGSALAQVALHLAADLKGRVPPNVLVVPAPLRSDGTPPPRAAELAGKVAAVLAGILGPTASVVTEPLPLGAARGRAKRFSAVLYAEAEVARGALRVSCDLYPVSRNIWDRTRDPAPPPKAHAYAETRIDAEIRSFLAPLPLLSGRAIEVKTDDHDIVGLACGDVDGDGTVELFTVGRKRVALGRIAGDRFVAGRTSLWKDLSPVAAAPLREPWATAVILPASGSPGRIDVGISDRAKGVRLDQDLHAVSTIAGLPMTVAGGDACVPAQGLGKALALAPCAPGDAAAPALGDLTPRIDALSAARVTARDGAVHVLRVARDAATGELSVRGETTAATLPLAGTALAVADLDQDGDPEVVSSLDVLDPAADALVVTSVQSDGSLHERFRVPVPAGIHALTVCPADDAGVLPIVLATAGGLWVVRP